MALIYRGRDTLLGRYVAIKILRDDQAHGADFDRQFQNEARAAANLSHPNIVTVYDFGLDNGLPFIVMELVPGTDLKSLLRKRGRFPVEEGIPLIVQACAGIGYAHRAGLVHCDVKPHNMLVTPDERLKVTDFGIARALATLNPAERSDVVWGSPQYYSPEQAAGHAPSPASDVYSLGVVSYEMLTGTLPFNCHRRGGAGAPAPGGQARATQRVRPRYPGGAGGDHPQGAFQGTLGALPHGGPTGPRADEVRHAARHGRDRGHAR